MEDSQKRNTIAQTVILSSLVTLVMVGGVLFLARAPIVAYIAASLPAPEVTTPSVASSDEQLVAMIERTEPAVVSVVATKDVPVYERYFEAIDPWGFFSVPRVRNNGTEEREVGGGSGFVVSNDGMIVTNAHVVSDEEARYSIVLSTGKSYQVDVMARDADLDIAVLKINEPIESPLPFVTFGDSQNLKLGQTVVAIGNALAEFQNTVSVGVVSGLSRTITASDAVTGQSEQLDQVIQTDAAINPGNSGGPLLNLNGEVVGVNVATSRGADNIGFALPAHVVKLAVESVREHGSIVRPYIGVRYTMLNERIIEQNNLTVAYGALVVRGDTEEALAVVPGSPADKVGIVENDIILSIDGVELRERDLATELRTKKVGQTITAEIFSKGEQKTISLTLEKAP